MRRVYGEVEADGLKDDLTAAGWGILENSKGYAALGDWVRSSVREQLDKTFRRDIALQRARLQQEINRRLAQLPACLLYTSPIMQPLPPIIHYLSPPRHRAENALTVFQLTRWN